MKKFITLLDDYINTKAQREGLPSIAWFADKCCLSTGYFGTLVKTETGRAAKDIIADRLLAHAKQLLNDDKLTITIIQEGILIPVCYHNWPGDFRFSLGGKRLSNSSAAASSTK